MTPPRRANPTRLAKLAIPRPLPRPLSRLPVGEQVSFNAPLYTLKAFTIATAIVASTATASVVGVMAYLDVHNTAEFAARMRTWVSQSMPLLTTKIYRYPTPRDSVPGDPVLLAASAPQHDSPTLDHDEAEQRLAEAFDRGGVEAWTEAAAREMEAEIQVERSRKNKTT